MLGGNQMTKPNMMKYFIREEGGTSSLLATLFDPQLKQPSKVAFLQTFCERLKSKGVSLSLDGPQVVKQEYMDIDIVMIWDNWIVVLENKISAASITRHQLQKYYNLIIDRVSKGSLLDKKEIKNKNICIVYLTPTQDIGVAEFNSLHLNEERQDAKIHLSWQVLLRDIEEIFRKEPATDPYVKLVRDGVDLTRQLLKKNKEREPKVPETEIRIEMKSFIDKFEQQIRAIMQPEPTLQLNIWRDVRADQLYGNVAGKNANVYFDLLEEGTSIPKKGTLKLHATFSAKVAGKAPRAYKKQFNEFPDSYWSAMLALRGDALVVDKQKHNAYVEVTWSGERSQLVQDAAALFCRFLITFRPFMIESKTSPAKPASRQSTQVQLKQ